MNKEQKQEIQFITELLEECLKEEGYEIPNNKYSDKDLEGFKIELKNKERFLNEVDLLIKW